MKFSPAVKQTFEPQTAKEHSNFEPRTPPYGPIYVGPMPMQLAPPDAGADIDARSQPFDLDGGPTPIPPPPIPLEAGVL